MDLKKNGFLIGIIAGLAVAAIGFFVLVLPKWNDSWTKSASVKNDYGPKLDEITGPGKEVPTAKWVSEIDAQANKVRDESKKLYGFFSASDAALERWFDDKEPPKGVLMSKAPDGILQMLKDLRAALGDKNVPLDGKAPYGDPNVLGFEFPRSEDVQDEHDAKLKWMRVYNIDSRVKDALIEAKAKRFYKVQFSKVPYPAEMASRQAEAPITNDLGTTIPFVVDASFLWKDIPAFLEAMLRYDATKPGPMFRVTMMHIERDRNFKIVPEIKVDVDKAVYEAGGWKAPEPAEDPVRVYLLVEAYNFTFTAATPK
ncbi:MAG: hypothetical protein K8T20_09405 [Planctomycetes bacterium]|nr:hypothetical protein [Planctomycetota bacterium]